MLPNPTIYGLVLNWYPFFHYIGLFSSIAFFLLYARKMGKKITTKYLLLLLTTLLLLLFGARLVGMWETFISTGNWPDVSIIYQPPSKGKFRWAGSVAAVFLLIPILGRLFKIKDYKAYLDILALSLCILTTITKQGCLFSGDGCYGIPTSLPWGMYFPYGVASNILPVHPTPIYDGIFHLLLFAFLLWFDKRKMTNGQTALYYFSLTSFFYILLEMIRINPKLEIGLTVSQVIYGSILLVCLFIIFRPSNKTKIERNYYT